MERTVLSVALAATIFFCVLNSAPAQAQPARVFVAAQGSDSNPCTFALPCRTFQKAHDTVAAGGEIDVLDPAGYGSVTITKSISIQGHGFGGIAATGNATAITINAGASDKINLRGLLIDGVGSGHNGIAFNTGASLNIQDSLVRNFLNAGILFGASTTSSLFVSTTAVADNRFYGIAVAPTGLGTVTAVLSRIQVDNIALDGMTGEGVGVHGGSAVTNVTVNDSAIANCDLGILVNGAPNVMIRSTTISNNGTGVISIGSTAAARLGRTVITGNGTGWTTIAGGEMYSYADNNIDSNAAGNTAPPPIPTK